MFSSYKEQCNQKCILHHALQWPTEFDFFKAILTNFDFLMTFSYLPTECGKNFTISGLSFAYYYVKDTYYEGY